MDPETFVAIHRYGAGVSVMAGLVALLAVVAGGPLAVLGPPLAFLAPLGILYFVGGVLEASGRHRIVGEELLRGIVWYGASLFAWAVILNGAPMVPTTIWTFPGLPIVTTAGLVGLLVAIRSWTGLELQVKTAGGSLLHFVGGSVLGGFLVLYAILAQDRSVLLVVLYVVSLVGGWYLWRRHWTGTED
ncbi:MAG: hypothetical protein ABEJ60_03485 [Halodesulfurarchaeum sp.]